MEKINLIPKYSEIENLNDISLSTNISKNLQIKIPILYSNESTNDINAIDIALKGGMGFINHDCSIAEQFKMINNVKKHLNFITHDPYTIRSNVNFNKLCDVFNSKNLDCILVSNVNNQLLGIITKKDIKYAELSENIKDIKVGDIMTTYENIKYSTEINCNLDHALSLIKKFKVKQFPIIDSNRIIKGIVNLKNIQKFLKYKSSFITDQNSELRCGASVGLTEDFLERCQKLIETNVDAIMIDYFHANSSIYLNFLDKFYKKFNKTDYNHIPNIFVGSYYSPDAITKLTKYNIDGIFIKLSEKSMISFDDIISLPKSIKKISIFISPILPINFNTIFRYLSLGYSAVMTDTDYFINETDLIKFIKFTKESMFMINSSKFISANK